jgi:hypothetical protein
LKDGINRTIGQAQTIAAFRAFVKIYLGYILSQGNGTYRTIGGTLTAAGAFIRVYAHLMNLLSKDYPDNVAGDFETFWS